MKVRLYLREWFYNAGIIGFLKIIKDYHDINVTKTNNYIEIETDELKNFSNYYFSYFYNIYNVAKRIKQKTDNSFEQIKKILKDINTSEKAEEKDKLSIKLKNQKKYIKDTIKYQMAKVKSVDESIYNKILENYNMIDSIKKEEDIEKLEKIFAKITEYFSLPAINDRLTLNLFKSVLSQKFYGQQSFLNVVKTKLSLDEQKDLMYRDYISNIVENGYLNDILLNKYTLDDIEKYCNEKKSDPLVTKEMQSIYSKILKKKKKATLIELQQYLKDQILNRCHICENENLNTSEYTEGNFIPLAISSDNMKNFFWNQNAKFPICDLCKLILFCIPAGVTNIIKIERQNEDGKQVYKEKEIYSFINEDTDVENLLKINTSFKQKSKKDRAEYNPYSQIILDIVDQNKVISDYQLQNIFFVEFESEYLAYSRMEYFHISRYALKFLKNYSEDIIGKILDYKFKLQLVDCILKNKSISNIINDRLRIVINDQNSKNLNILGGFNCLEAARANLTLNLLKKGVNDMEEIKKQNSKLWSLYHAGQDIRKKCVDDNTDNKLTSYAYRMLNSVKANNKKEFMDTVIRLYLFLDLNIPSTFIEVMQDGNLDFESIGHSFISGLISDKYEKKDNTNENSTAM